MNEYHVPVLLESSVAGLAIEKSKRQIFVDLTFGGGGHAAYILKKMGRESVLYAFDQDFDAAVNEIDDERLILIETNFRYFRKFLRLFDISQVDGILADLGVSSYQLDEKSRGFSYRSDQILDMRMSIDQEMTAADVLNNYSEDELVRIFSGYGEIRNSKQLARKIVFDRQRIVFSRSEGFVQCIQGVIMGNRIKYLSQVFQALRIEVNDEMNALADMLSETVEILKPGGRLVIISYHSLEDRMVKNLIKKGLPDGKKTGGDIYGNSLIPFKEVVKGIVIPTEGELISNPRSRSAKLRIAEKL